MELPANSLNITECGNGQELPPEVWERIVLHTLDSVRSVDVISRVCRYWREIVYGFPWKFYGYLPVSVLEKFPELPEPENAFFLISKDAFEDETTDTLMDWVTKKRVKRLWLHLPGSSIEGGQLYTSGVLETLILAGVEDLLIRVVKNHGLTDTIDYGFWYQEKWQCSEHPEWGTGRMVVDPDRYKESLGLIKDTQSAYLVFSSFVDDTCDVYADSLPTCVRVLGITGSDGLDEIVVHSEVEEIRVLDSDPLNPYEDERYGDIRGILKYEDLEVAPVSTTVRSFRGAVSDFRIHQALAIFPNLPLIHASYRESLEISMLPPSIPAIPGAPEINPSFLPPIPPISSDPIPRAVCRMIQDPRVKTFIPTFNMQSFWSDITEGLYQAITQYLSFRDIMFLTQVFRIRHKMGMISRPRIPASILRSSFSHGQISDDCSVLVTDPSDFGIVGGLLSTNIRCTIIVEEPLGSPSLLPATLELLEKELHKSRNSLNTRFLDVSKTTTIVFPRIPGARIVINRNADIVTVHIPVSQYQWHQRFNDTNFMIKDAQVTSFHPDFYRKYRIECHFF